MTHTIHHKILLSVIITLLCCFFDGAIHIGAMAEKKSERSEEKEMIIAVVAKRGKQKSIDKWQPTADYLTAHIPGYRFTVAPYTWAEIREVVSKGTADFVLTNPGMYVEFEALHDVRRIATLKNVRLGRPYTSFGVVLFCRADRTDIQNPEDIKGKRLAAVNETAWGGWQVGWRQLLELGIDPYKDLDELTFAGSHDNVVYAVRDGTTDVGNVRTDTIERMASESKIKMADFKPIYINREYGDEFPFWLSTKLYPEWPFATATHTPMELNEKVAIALMSITSDSVAARSGLYEGWTVPSNYQPVHETLRMLKVTPYERYGEITMKAVLLKYWKELILINLIALGMAVAAFYFRRLNLRLLKTQNELQLASSDLQEKNRELEQTLEQVKQMQDQIVMQEKMASLGALTAGIAHEIKNPLNFVINFSELTGDLVNDLKEELEDVKDALSQETRDYIFEILADMFTNAGKINEHGKRADGIVRNMLDHSRGQSGKSQTLDVNKFIDEYVQLGYHGMRGSDADFNVDIQTDYDPDAASFEVFPQDLSRVILNIVNNACYAVREKEQQSGDSYTPTLIVSTKKINASIEIRIRDNGTGMPQEVKEKIFNPFFTTKPTGSGTGLGLSMSYDTVVQVHKGAFEVESVHGEYTEFTIVVPDAISS